MVNALLLKNFDILPAKCKKNCDIIIIDKIILIIPFGTVSFPYRAI